jgi:hypothetical protein
LYGQVIVEKIIRSQKIAPEVERRWYMAGKKIIAMDVLPDSTVLSPVCRYYKRDHQAGQQEQWRNGMKGGSGI